MTDPTRARPRDRTEPTRLQPDGWRQRRAQRTRPRGRQNRGADERRPGKMVAIFPEEPMEAGGPAGRMGVAGTRSRPRPRGRPPAAIEVPALRRKQAGHRIPDRNGRHTNPGRTAGFREDSQRLSTELQELDQLTAEQRSEVSSGQRRSALIDAINARSRATAAAITARDGADNCRNR